MTSELCLTHQGSDLSWPALLLATDFRCELLSYVGEVKVRFGILNRGFLKKKTAIRQQISASVFYARQAKVLRFTWMRERRLRHHGDIMISQHVSVWKVT